MKIISITREDSDIPDNISEKTEKIGRLIVYLFNTKDENLIKSDIIDRIEIYDTSFVKIYFKDNNNNFIFDYSIIEWLKTHHYMFKAKYCKEEAEKLYDLIDGNLDWFVVDDWYIRNKTQFSYQDSKGEVTFDKDFIYVKGKSTGLKMTPDMVVFVLQNKNKWY